MVAYSFNATQVEPKYGGGGGLPVGPNGEPQKYKVIIAGSEGKPTKDGKGSYAQLSLKCVEGPFNGVIQHDNLNLFNLSPQAVEIANKQLSAYCHVVGKFAISDIDELSNIPFWVEIRLQKEPNPQRYTEVSNVFDINGNEPGKAGAGPVQAAAAPPPLQPPAGVGPQGGGFQPPQGQPGFPPQGQPQQQAQPAAPPQGWAGGPPQGQPGQPGPAYGAPAGFPQQQQPQQPAQTFQPPQGGPPAGWAGGPAAGGPGNGWPGQ